jgi:hypothetical protein
MGQRVRGCHAREDDVGGEGCDAAPRSPLPTGRRARAVSPFQHADPFWAGAVRWGGFTRSREASQPARIDIRGTEGHPGHLVPDHAALESERSDLTGPRRAAVQLSEDALVHTSEGEPDRGDCVRTCPPNVQKPKASGDDPAAAAVVDDLLASTSAADLQTSCVPPPVPRKEARGSSLVSAACRKRQEHE